MSKIWGFNITKNVIPIYFIYADFWIRYIKFRTNQAASPSTALLRKLTINPFVLIRLLASVEKRKFYRKIIKTCHVFFLEISWRIPLFIKTNKNTKVYKSAYVHLRSLLAISYRNRDRFSYLSVKSWDRKKKSIWRYKCNDQMLSTINLPFTLSGCVRNVVSIDCNVVDHISWDLLSSVKCENTYLKHSNFLCLLNII